MSDSTPDVGKTTVDDKMTFEAERLSYEAADGIAARIASDLGTDLAGRTVVIASTALLADFANLEGLQVTLTELHAEYDAITKRAGGTVPGAPPPTEKPLTDAQPLRVNEALVPPGSKAGAVIGGAVAAGVGGFLPLLNAGLGLVGLLKQDTEYHGDRSTLDPLAFEIALAGRVKLAGAAKVVVPNLTVFKPSKGHGGLVWRLKWLQAAKSAAWSSVGPLIAKLVGVEKLLADAQAAKHNDEVDRLSKELTSIRGELDPLALPIERADQRLADLKANWEKIDDTTGWSPLARMLRAEALREDRPLYLHAAIVSSGGHHRVNRSLWQLLSFSDGLSFNGGAVARWALLDASGAISRGGILTERLRSKS